MARRLVPLLLLTPVIALSGCATRGAGPLAKVSDPLPRLPTPDVARIIEDHNRNAERVVNLQTEPSITVAMNDKREAGLSGRLAIQRPRNFKLLLGTAWSNEADIGSNEEGSWLWLKQSNEKAVFVTRYDESGESPLGVGLQPDWIIEAMGLRVISPEEARTARVDRLSDGLGYQLTTKQTGADGRVYSKIAIMNEGGQVAQRRLEVVKNGQPQRVASAKIRSYKSVASGSDEPSETVRIPADMTLTWYHPLSQRPGLEKIELDVVMGRYVNLTREIPSTMFVEPKPDLPRLTLGEPQPTGGSQYRETRPIPPTQAKVQLRPPVRDAEPLGPDGATRTSADPIPLGADLEPADRTEGVLVRPPIPTAPGSRPIRVEGVAGNRLDRPAVEN